MVTSAREPAKSIGRIRGYTRGFHNMTLQQNCRPGKVLGGGKRAAVRGGVGCGGSAMGQSAELSCYPESELLILLRDSGAGVQSMKLSTNCVVLAVALDLTGGKRCLCRKRRSICICSGTID